MAFEIKPSQFNTLQYVKSLKFKGSTDKDLNNSATVADINRVEEKIDQIQNQLAMVMKVVSKLNSSKDSNIKEKNISDSSQQSANSISEEASQILKNNLYLKNIQPENFDPFREPNLVKAVKKLQETGNNKEISNFLVVFENCHPNGVKKLNPNDITCKTQKSDNSITTDAYLNSKSMYGKPVQSKLAQIVNGNIEQIYGAYRYDA